MLEERTEQNGDTCCVARRIGGRVLLDHCLSGVPATLTPGAERHWTCAAPGPSQSSSPPNTAMRVGHWVPPLSRHTHAARLRRLRSGGRAE